MPVTVTHFHTDENGNSLTFAFLENWDKGLPKKDQPHFNEGYRLEIIKQLSLLSTKKNRTFEILSASFNRNKEVLYFTVRLKYHTQLHDMETPYKLSLAENPPQPKKDNSPRIAIAPQIINPFELPFFAEKSPIEKEFWLDMALFEKSNSIASSCFAAMKMGKR